jgi:hypothetical protein
VSVVRIGGRGGIEVVMHSLATTTIPPSRLQITSCANIALPHTITTSQIAVAMNLIAYSDSEDSDTEATPVVKTTAKPAAKPAFQKVVDSANPGKIKINLPGVSRPQAQKDDLDADAPPAKKARIGGGGFSAFNSMLPAPKKPNVNLVDAESSKKGVGRGLGSGVNLKTGAEPAFKREPKMYAEEDQVPLQKDDFRAMLNLPPTKTAAPKSEAHEIESTPAPETKTSTKPRFVPMSVGRGKKRKPAAPRPALEMTEAHVAIPAAATTSTVETQPPKPAARPRVSLFSVSQDEQAIPANNSSSGGYQPLLHGLQEDDDDAEMPDEVFGEESFDQVAPSAILSSGQGGTAQPQDLTTIATELNLSAAEKRQLFGRKGHGPDISAATIVDFNTDTEYAHNERLRQQGETVQHNALKSISGTGKNSLKSLISAATTQKEALEEHFAAGRRNKREAGSKFGW